MKPLDGIKVLAPKSGLSTRKALPVRDEERHTPDPTIERTTRDLRIMRIYESSSKIQRNIIAGHLPAH